MLKVVKNAFREPGTNTIKTVVVFFVGYDIVNDKVVKNHVSFYVYGPGEFEWEEWIRDWKTSSGKYAVYKASEVARLVNKYTGSSINYGAIREMDTDILSNIQSKHDYKRFQEERDSITTSVKNELTDAIQRVVKKHHLTFKQENDTIRDYEDSYDVTSYLFNGESHGHKYSIYLDGILKAALESIKNENNG